MLVCKQQLGHVKASLPAPQVGLCITAVAQQLPALRFGDLPLSMHAPCLTPPVLLALPLPCQMAVVALQPLLSRETDPLQSGVVTVSRFNTGGRLSIWSQRNQAHCGAGWMRR